MKTIISIPLVLLLLFSGVSVKVAIHYCGGYVAATKVSLTGELATCGMVSSENDESSQEAFKKHCCDDVMSAYSFDNNYVPSFFNVEKPFQHIISLLIYPDDLTISQFENLNTSSSIIKPPGDYFYNSTDLPVLCIFRI